MAEKLSSRDAEEQKKRLPPQFYAFLQQRLSTTAAPPASAAELSSAPDAPPQTQDARGHVEMSESSVGSEEYDDVYDAGSEVDVSDSEEGERYDEYDDDGQRVEEEDEGGEGVDSAVEPYSETFSLRKQIDARLALLQREPEQQEKNEIREHEEERNQYHHQHHYNHHSPSMSTPMAAAPTESHDSAHVAVESAASVRSMLSVLRRITDTCVEEGFESRHQDHLEGERRGVGGGGNTDEANANEQLAGRRPRRTVGEGESMERKEDVAALRIHRIPHAPPPKNLSIPSLSFIAKNVWFHIGLFNFKPVRPTTSSSSSRGVSMNEGSSAGEEEKLNRLREVDILVASLERYLGLCIGDKDTHTMESEGSSNSFQQPLPLRSLRNALWLLLHNTVYYCVAVLADGAHTTASSNSNSNSNKNKHAEYRSGGIEDDFEVVFSSSSSSASSSADPSAKEGARRIPSKLSWPSGGSSSGSAKGSQFRRRQRPFTRESNHPHDSEAESAAALAKPSDARRQEFLRGRRDALEPFHGRLATPLTPTEWYFVVRCMAEMSYPRQSFYLCTPMRANLCELLVAMLWLTKRHCLVSVAEFLVLQERFPFMLAGSLSASIKNQNGINSGGDNSEPSSAHASMSVHERRLLSQFPAAVPWPPSTFEEEQRVAQRLAQLDTLAASATAPQKAPVPPAASRASAYLLALRRLTSLSLNRMDVALQRRAEQTVLLGLHSALDAELCLLENDSAYTALLDGLEYVASTEERVSGTARELSKLGSILASAVRMERITDPARAYSAQLPSSQNELPLPPLRIEDVLEAMHDDDDTWLNKDGGAAERASVGSLVLGDAVRQFKATRTLELLTERWRSMVRRARARAVGTPSRPDRHGQRTLHPILLDESAQRDQDEMIAMNVASRYSLEAALAAEWIALQIEETERSWRAAVTSGRMSDANVEDDKDNVREERESIVCGAPLHPHLPFELTFDQRRVLSRCTPQRTEVGLPPAGTSTSARLAIAQLEAATAQLEEIEVTRVQDDLDVGYALHDELTRLGLRVVNRRRGRRSLEK